MAPELDDFEPYLEDGRLLFAKECRFVIGAVNVEDIPPTSLPEVAFAGRSNVGKSSLVNALTGRKTLARTSSKPGHTRQVNFFNLGERLMLVDLPGYGYAKVSRKEVAGWGKMIQDFLQGSTNLQVICLLIDGRHGVKESDEQLMSFLDEIAVPYQIILTKMDKVKKGEQDERLEQVKRVVSKHGAALPYLFPTSAEKKTGIDYLRASLARFAVES